MDKVKDDLDIVNIIQSIHKLKATQAVLVAQNAVTDPELLDKARNLYIEKQTLEDEYSHIWPFNLMGKYKTPS